jgi:hypothetical protein
MPFIKVVKNSMRTWLILSYASAAAPGARHRNLPAPAAQLTKPSQPCFRGLRAIRKIFLMKIFLIALRQLGLVARLPVLAQQG